jgi:hypothetical protein
MNQFSGVEELIQIFEPEESDFFTEHSIDSLNNQISFLVQMTQRLHVNGGTCTWQEFAVISASKYLSLSSQCYLII